MTGRVLDGHAIRDRIAAARDHLTTAVKNALWDLGKTGMTAGREILSEISGELDDIEQLAGEADDELSCTGCWHLWKHHAEDGCRGKIYPAHSLTGEPCPCERTAPDG